VRDRQLTSTIALATDDEKLVKHKHDDSHSLGDWLRARGPAVGLGDAQVKGLLAPDDAPPADSGITDDGELIQTLEMLVGLRVDADVLVATILHQRRALFAAAGTALAKLFPDLPALLEGQRAAEQVWRLYAGRPAGGDSEGLRRLLLALIKDVRGILIVLTRHLLQLRAAASLPANERQALARLSADILAPLANRLGIWQVKWEMEDLAFRFLQPETYRRIANLLDEKRGDREQFIEQAKSRILVALRDAGIDADVAGRPKHIYSIWKKMQRKDLPFSELYDIRAVRVLVNDVASCYATLGLVHSLWSPVASEFDDYIANPKGNSYRSLHTAVIGPGGRTLEVQIRTHEMHAHAELGVAAHWRYKEGGGADAGFERKIAWMRQLLEGRGEDDDSALVAGLSSDLIEDRVYVLTPRGEVIDLPRGGTVLDFAYHVHTEVGHRCRGAKVNGRIVPLTHAPATGDQVEILTAKTSEPRRDWLSPGSGLLVSARARDKVRAWFHRLDHARNVQAGRELLDRELKRMALHKHDLSPVLARFRVQSLDELHVAVSLGDIGPSQVARVLHENLSGEETRETSRPESKVKPPRPDQHFVVEGVGNLLTQLARCCQPVAGDAVVGYLTRTRGVSVHRHNCSTFARLAVKHPERVLPVEWGRQGRSSYSVDVRVRAVDRKGLLKDLTNVIAQLGAHVLAVNSHLDEVRAAAELRFTLKVSDFEQLGHLLARLTAVSGVGEVVRLSE
jgi:GTP pyrophosphokinase